MTAQFLYDFREEWEFCSGTDLGEFFRSETNGDASPRGHVKVDAKRAVKFVRSCLESMKHNNPSPTTNEHCIAASLALYNSAR